MESSVTLQVPSDFDFRQLNLRCDRETLDIEFDVQAIEDMGVDIEGALDDNEILVMGILQSLYEMHLKSGGEPDPAAEVLFAWALASEEIDEPFLMAAPLTLQ